MLIRSVLPLLLVQAAATGLAAPADTTLRIPPKPVQLASEPEQAPPASWYLRLEVSCSCGIVPDRSNILGRIPNARDGQDSLDSEEAAPFANGFLTIVFPHPEWSGDAWSYTTDYRELRAGAGGTWAFEVRSDTPREITLSWQLGSSDTSILSRSLLVDEVNGVTIDPGRTGSYTVMMAAASHAFRWQVSSVPQVAAGPDLQVVADLPLFLAADLSDEDAEDRHTATIDWGDGTVTPGLVNPVERLRSSHDPKAGTVRGSHTYTDEAEVVIDVCAVDRHGNTGCDSLQVTVLKIAIFFDGFESGETGSWSVTRR